MLMSWPGGQKFTLTACQGIVSLNPMADDKDKDISARAGHDRYYWQTDGGPRGPLVHGPRSRIQKVKDRDIRRWLQASTWENPRWRFRFLEALQNFELPVPIMLAVLKATAPRLFNDKGLFDALDDSAGTGLINVILRKALTEDPLAQAKVVNAKVIEREPALPAITQGQLETIIPPSKPRKPKGSGPPLKPGEEIMP